MPPAQDQPETQVGINRPPTEADSWDTYNFEWLFDPDRIDHLSIEDQLLLYRQNNLKGTKVYKFASRIWGAPRSRKRVINAHLDDDRPQSTQLRVQPRPQVLADRTSDDEKLREAQERNKKLLGDYRSWIGQRKQFRKNLDSMGLDEDWLRRKPDKTGQEQRVLARMIEQRTAKPPSPEPPEELPVSPVLPETPPMLTRTCPLALKIIERFLHRKKLRLIDLFRDVDKKKNWMISEGDFRRSIRKANIPISDVLLDDLVITLDVNLDNKLDYRELSRGLALWKLEKRETKQQTVADLKDSRAPEKISQALGFELPGEGDHEVEKLPSVTSEGSEPPKARVKSSSSTGSSSYLEVPPSDMRGERRMMSSDEGTVDMRARNRAVLRRLTITKNNKKRKSSPSEKRSTLIKTGDLEADRHLMPSTLTDNTAEMVHKFRQLKYREYNDIWNISQTDDNVQLSEQALKKVLLYPEDKAHHVLARNLRQPAMPLLHRADVMGTVRKF